MSLTIWVLSHRTEAGTTLFIAPLTKTEINQLNASKTDGYTVTQDALDSILIPCLERALSRGSAVWTPNQFVPPAVTSLNFGSNSTLSLWMSNKYHIKNLIKEVGELFPEAGECDRVFLYHILIQPEKKLSTSKYDIWKAIEDLHFREIAHQQPMVSNNFDIVSVILLLLREVEIQLYLAWQESPQSHCLPPQVKPPLLKWKRTPKGWGLRSCVQEIMTKLGKD